MELLNVYRHFLNKHFRKMNLKINGKKHNVKPISQLSFEEYNRIVIQGKVATLPEYIALITDYPVEDVMQSEIEASSTPYIHQMIFDCDVQKELKEKRETVKVRDETYLTNELTLKSFGKSYYFDLYLQKHVEKKINEYELAMYALAIAISDELSDKVEQVYQDLANQNWRKVLPQAFFLAVKSRRLRPISIKLLKASMQELKKTHSKTRYYLNHLKNTERNSSANYSAKSLTSPLMS